LCYLGLFNIPKAIEELQRALEVSPNNQFARGNLAAYLSYDGDFQASEQEARTLLKASPSYEQAYQVLAFAQVGQGQLAEAVKTYQQLEKISDQGQSSAAQGLADIALYEGRLGEAAKLMQHGAALDVQAGRLDSAAANFAELGHLQLLRKQRTAALAA